MPSFADSPRDRFRLIALLLPVTFFVGGCASTPAVVASPQPPAHIVEGSGTAEDRKVITNSDQHMLETEQAAVPVPAAPTPNQGVP